MDSSQLMHLALASVISIVGFSVVYYIYNSFSKPESPQRETNSKSTAEQSSNKKEDKKLKDRKEKNNKKPTKKTITKEDTKNENRSPKNENQQQTTKKFSNAGDELRSPTKKGNHANNKVKEDRLSTSQDDSPTKPASSENNNGKQLKKNPSPVDEEKQQLKTPTPKQSKKQLQHQIEKELMQDIEQPIEEIEKKPVEKSVVTEKLNTSSQFNLESDISITKLVEVIKTVPLSNEETQVIIDALLSKNTSENDWVNKNDPITVLKKQLEDKELELKNETENHERAKNRIIMMRDEFNADKQKYLNYKEQVNQQNAKIQQLELKLLKIEEYKQEEYARLHANFSKSQKKLLDDSTKRIQEEQAKAQQALNQLENEKAQQNVLSFQVIQLNNERQQFESIKVGLEELNETLKNENQSLNERIVQLINELEANKYSYEEKSKELNSNAANTAQLQSKIDQLIDESKQLNEELLSLRNEKTSLVKQLNEIGKVNEDKLLDDVKVLVGSYKSTVDSQSNTKDETKKLKDRLNDEVKKTSDLEKRLEKFGELEKKVEMQAEKLVEFEKKVKHYEDTLIQTEKQLEKVGKTADQEFKNWNNLVEKSEAAYKEISKEHEKLKNELVSS